jgi:hypothetical protein
VVVVVVTVPPVMVVVVVVVATHVPHVIGHSSDQDSSHVFDADWHNG